MTTPHKRPTRASAKREADTPSPRSKSSPRKPRPPSPRQSILARTNPLPIIQAYAAAVITYLTSCVYLYGLIFSNWLNAKTGTQTKPYSALKNKIVIIGDDHAFGYGDDLSVAGTSGIAGHLRRALLGERYNLRQSWVIHNRGAMGTTSEDWLPKNAKAPNAGRTKFEAVFEDPTYADADVVIVFLGSNDYRNPTLDPESTVRNIAATCRTLSTMGKDVWICTIPNHNDEPKGDAVVEANMRRNEILGLWIQSNQEIVKPGPPLDALSYDFRHKSFWTSDGQHFSAKGYRKLAKDLADLMRTSLVKREFARLSKSVKF
ncbi:SGNH hydrolase-type esterase domain-containing protein [Fimicolochytrium jonesii]|uniref:SGNH hydrolase-type esterase domain-containing protein n=1 Tax=Fimicolochytrium jonesii TaxID=1396493 RepID=UPI0022FED49A|nr:SGNH hydrolase-type esterase domain-containing protein [Fimicolochytrium jonesii]KAI8821379.1 SGNH hydrolase-type esterase domain-containing protein [Fimicolochytrium jonesii]